MIQTLFRMSRFYVVLLACIPFGSTGLIGHELRWNWDAIEPIALEDLHFPAHFMWGTAISSHQTEGNCNCQWYHFEHQKDWLGNHCQEKANMTCDHWNRYKEDTKLIQDLGVNAHRFSLEWSKIEPAQGHFNQDAIDHYHKVIDHLLDHNIIPVITLHHFTHPQWFEDLDAFEKEENIYFFVRYCTKMFEEFSHKVSFWCTINEPSVYAFQGYIRCVFPPAKNSVQLAGTVTKNLILAHIYAYKAMKAMPHGPCCQIGITHSITLFDPYNPSNRIDTWLSHCMNHTMHDAFLQFFVTGKFYFEAPKVLGLLFAGNPYTMVTSLFPLALGLNSIVEFDYADIANKDYQAQDILDFFGIQPYSHVLIDWTNTQAATSPTMREGDIPTDMPYTIYPEIMERAVHEASHIGVPLYITENGIADAKDDRRELFIRRYLYALSQVIKKGYDVRGYFYWSLFDNFEWDFGYDKKFGLYEVDFKTQKRTLRQGGAYYKTVIEHHKQRHHIN